MSNTLIGSHTSTYLETEKNVRVAVESMNNLIREYVLKIIAADPTSTNLPTLIRESGMFTTVETAGSYNYKLAELYHKNNVNDISLGYLDTRVQSKSSALPIIDSNATNLLLDSGSFSTNTWKYIKHASETASVEYGNDGSVILKGNVSAWKFYSQKHTNNPNLERILDGNTYTLSYEAKGDVELRIWYRISYSDSKANVEKLFKQNVTSDWERYNLSFSISNVSRDSINSISILFESSSVGTVEVRKPKLELGNKATDWSPAPEDVATPYVAFTSSSGIWYLDAQAFLDDKNAWETVITNAMRSVSVNSRTPFQLLKSRLDSNKLQYLPL